MNKNVTNIKLYTKIILLYNDNNSSLFIYTYIIILCIKLLKLFKRNISLNCIKIIINKIIRSRVVKEKKKFAIL